MQETIKQKMSQMKFYGMYQAYQTVLDKNHHHTLTNDEFIDLLIQAEWDDRESRRVNRYIRSARFRYQASMEEVNFTHERNLDKTSFLRLADCSFIKRKEDLLITGKTGSGKSFIASAIGHQACLNGYKTLYFNSQKFFTRLKIAKADGTYLKEINKIEKQDLLILDDFGLQPLDTYKRYALMEVIEDRHGRKSTLICSQLPVSSWYDIIGESTIADAIMDRLVHSSNRIDFDGDSLRGKL